MAMIHSMPPRSLEYLYYLLVFYALMGSALGLGVSMLGPALMGLLAVYCLMRARSVASFGPLLLPLCCGISFILIQKIVHDESPAGDLVRPFVTWILNLIVVHAISHRPGLLQRYATIALLIGLCLMPFMQVYAGGDVDRLGIDRTTGMGLANPNDIAAWFGFCAIFFLVAGMETKSSLGQIVFWIMAAVSVYGVGLTVTRAPILAVAVAAAVAMRRFLKRGFVPLLLLSLSAFAIFELGVFSDIVSSYAVRGLQETGRLAIWPLAAERFIVHFWTGVGIANAAVAVPPNYREITPHNSFLFLALSSGIIPLLFFIGYWWRAIKGAIRPVIQSSSTPFILPVLIYAFLIALELNMPFMSSWMIVTLSVATLAGTRQKVRIRRQVVLPIRHAGSLRRAKVPKTTVPLTHSGEPF